MQYTYVAWLGQDGQWQAFCPTWPAVTASAGSRSDCVKMLVDKLTEQCSELFCRELPMPRDVPVQVGSLPVLEGEFAPWG